MITRWRFWLAMLLLLAPTLAWAQGMLINGSRVIAGTLNAATTTGTANAYLLTLDPAITAYILNQCFTFRANFTNTGPATMNINGVGAVPLSKYVSTVPTALVAGDIASGQIIETCYDGIGLQLVATGAPAGGGGPDLSATHVLTTQAEAALSAESNLGALASGVLKHSVSGGVSTPATAIAGTDYVVPGGTVATATALAANGANCGPGLAAQGTDASGNAEGCFAPAASTTMTVTEVDGSPTGAFSTLKFSNGSVSNNGDGSATIITGAGGGGDFSSNTSSSVDGEAMVFSGAGGKTGRRATLTAPVVKSTAGVQSAAVAGTDYVVPSGTVATATALVANGTNCGLGLAAQGTDASGNAEGCFAPTLDANPWGIACDGITQTAVAIQNALNSVPVGARLVLPPGVCLLNQTLTITQSVTLEGAGMQHTFLRQTVPNIPVLVMGSVDAVLLARFTDEHTGTPVAGGDGIVADLPAGLNNMYLQHVAADKNFRGFVLGCVAYGVATGLQATFNNSNGFEFSYRTGCFPVQWDISHSIASLNKGAGFFGHNTASSNGIGPMLSDVWTFANEFGGFVFLGTATTPINDLHLRDILASADNREGIFLDTYGGSHIISSPWVELAGRSDGFPLGQPSTPSVMSNLGNCVTITQNNAPGLSIHGGHFWNCSFSGITMAAAFSSVIGGSSKGNGQALSTDVSRRVGVHIANNGVMVSGHTFSYQDAATLHYIAMTGAGLNSIPLGANTYDPALPLSAIVHATGASFSGFTSTQMAGGLLVHTGAPHAPALALIDVTNGPAPAKSLRAASGNLEVLNAASSTVISTLSDVGTPGWPARRGQATISGTATTTTVTLTPGEPDNGYFVQLTVAGALGPSPEGALTVVGVVKNAGSFVITTVAAPGAGKYVLFDWLLHR